MRAIKAKAYFVIAFIHVSLGVALYSLARLWEHKLAAPSVHWATVGVAGIYVGLLMGALFLYLPLRPWLRRARYVKDWKRWIEQELPTFIALIPVVIGIAHILKAAWDELKAHKAKNELNIQTLSGLLTRVAGETETAIRHGGKVTELASKRASKHRANGSRRKAA